MKVIIDSNEQDRRISAVRYYNKLNLDVKVDKLEIGDYLFSDSVVFEWKLASDFIGSVLDNRVFKQAINQAESYPYHYVIIVGSIRQAIKKLFYSTGNNFTLQQYDGAVRRLRTITNVILVGTEDNTDKNYEHAGFNEMYEQAIKCLENKPLISYLPRKYPNPCLGALCVLPKIGYNTAIKIVQSLNLKSLSDYFNMTYEDLISVDGIGKNKANMILKNRGNL